MKLERTFDYPWSAGARGREYELSKARESAFEEAHRLTGASCLRYLGASLEPHPATRRAWGAVGVKVTFTFKEDR